MFSLNRPAAPLRLLQPACRFGMHVDMRRDYADAVAALNSLQSNFAVVQAVKKAGPEKHARAIPEMLEWTRRVGYQPSQFDVIKPIHIAGTKGKGSTSAFISSILCEYKKTGASKAPQKIGLYTSPHLRFVRERIQIDNEMLSEAAFAKYFFQVWDRLEAAAVGTGVDPRSTAAKPMYFRFLTLMAFHTFLSEGVDSAVIECGMGGEYDSTNIIVSPTVTAITALGIDHVEMLGNTLPEIAWHKAGIFKRGAPAFVSPQLQPAIEVIKQRAAERDVSLTIVERHPDTETLNLGLAADFQKANASLAVSVSAAHLRALGNDNVPEPAQIASSAIPPPFRSGLETVRWPGRCEIRREPSITWHMDGAHTLESIAAAGQWYVSEILSPDGRSDHGRILRVLLFNQQMRNAEAMATSLHSLTASALASHHPASKNVASSFDHVVFCTNVTFRDAGYMPDLVSINTNAREVGDLTVQNRLAQAWKALDPGANVVVKRTIEEAVAWCRSVAEGGDARVFVTGSLHLVGGVLEVLESKC